MSFKSEWEAIDRQRNIAHLKEEVVAAAKEWQSPGKFEKDYLRELSAAVKALIQAEAENEEKVDV